MICNFQNNLISLKNLFFTNLQNKLVEDCFQKLPEEMWVNIIKKLTKENLMALEMCSLDFSRIVGEEKTRRITKRYINQP